MTLEITKDHGMTQGNKGTKTNCTDRIESSFSSKPA